MDTWRSTAAPPAARSPADQHNGDSPRPATVPSSNRLSHASSSIARCPVRVTRGSAQQTAVHYPRVPHFAACGRTTNLRRFGPLWGMSWSGFEPMTKA